MSESHKAALEQGRSESRVVREYLDALSSKRRGPGRRRSAETIEARLATINDELHTADSLQQLVLIQERRDLEAEQAALSTDDLAELEERFLVVAKSFADRRGIAYATWRDVGVSTDVLARAGIARSG